MEHVAYEAIVIGAGHAGCEAALALARTGHRTLCLTLSLEAVAYMACNPAIGGTSKGHLVREVDALGGEMGLAIDETYLQSRMINTKKGPAVHSLRAQADKAAYSARMKRALLQEPLLTLLQGEAKEIVVENGVLRGVLTTHGQFFSAPVVIVAAGVYLQSRILAGEFCEQTGPSGLMRSSHLSAAIQALGFSRMRFKTGTPPRINARTVDFAKMEPQNGDDPITPFSFLTTQLPRTPQQQIPCYLTYTNEQTHTILRENLHRSPMYSGVIQGMGARYCPSIEDKIVRFAHKDRHQLFLEPEGASECEWYLQGFSTSMPFDVQLRALHTVPGLEHAEVTRYGYAIEYDCIDARDLTPALMAKSVPGLFFAGQICGSSGYEEAAAQGILAGINAAQYLSGREPILIGRHEGYLGVLVDDLVTLGTPEPYRMMTSRAEYRLSLRQDNADLRLTKYGAQCGLASAQRIALCEQRAKKLEEMQDLVQTARIAKPQAQALEAQAQIHVEPGTPLRQVLSRGDLQPEILHRVFFPDLNREMAQLVLTEVKYAGYIQRQQREIQEFLRMETMPLPQDADYAAMEGLRLEAREKLARIKPETLGRASRISGVSPGDIAVLSVWLKRLQREGKMP